ncbi:MAG: SDR family oxidoreductase, partial [Saprospiraceae bacterium]
EVGSRSIRCNAIAPGFIETEMTHGLDDKTKDQYFTGLAIKRFGTGNEVADLAAFLASDASKYITGQVISICGGLNM